MTLEVFKQKFEELKNKGFVSSIRRGPTGVGKTLEHHLGLSENNKASPDLQGIELKAHRDKSGSLITLFTFNRKAWQMKPLEAIRQYGTLDENGRLGLYYTLSLDKNPAGLSLKVEEDKIFVQHTSGQVVVSWPLQAVVERFIKKIPALILVSAHAQTDKDGNEHFHFHKARLLRGTSPELLAKHFKERNILIDLRLHDKGTRARNHGTGFRIYEHKLDLVFASIENL